MGIISALCLKLYLFFGCKCFGDGTLVGVKILILSIFCTQNREKTRKNSKFLTVKIRKILENQCLKCLLIVNKNNKNNSSRAIIIIRLGFYFGVILTNFGLLCKVFNAFKYVLS